mmetsp:Transcript_27729/g.90753  ORF Transcript_27729/g.90753 Transcript_27729/m.90753 type:complete len:110 (-) Transcript_27729:673-1002(-)
MRYCSSHTHASRSRWFVGSSSSKSVGCTKSARARATRMRQPPDMSFVFFLSILSLNPRPTSSFVAWVSNEDGSSSSSFSYMSWRRSSSGPISSMMRSSSALSRLISSWM